MQAPANTKQLCRHAPAGHAAVAHPCLTRPAPPPCPPPAQFVNFKLYHQVGLRYPPVLDPKLEQVRWGGAVGGWWLVAGGGWWWGWLGGAGWDAAGRRAPALPAGRLAFCAMPPPTPPRPPLTLPARPRLGWRR